MHVHAYAHVAKGGHDWVKCTHVRMHEHAHAQVAKGGHDWVRNDDGSWSGPADEHRHVVCTYGGETDEEEPPHEDSSEPEDDDEDGMDEDGGE